MTRGLGEHWELLALAYKPYPCGVVIHPVIDACLDLRAEHSIKATDISRIEVAVHPLAIKLCGNQAPRDGLEAKLSIAHSVAVALTDGAAGVAQYRDAHVSDPAIMALLGSHIGFGAGAGVVGMLAVLATVGAFGIWWGGSSSPARPITSGLLLFMLPIGVLFLEAVLRPDEKGQRAPIPQALRVYAPPCAWASGAGTSTSTVSRTASLCVCRKTASPPPGRALACSKWFK